MKLKFFRALTGEECEKEYNAMHDKGMQPRSSNIFPIMNEHGQSSDIFNMFVWYEEQPQKTQIKTTL